MPFSLIDKLCDMPIAVLDLETTGASAQFGHRAIEVGIVRLEHGRRVAEYQQLIDPQRRITAGVTALTGISQSMVEGQPTFAQQFSPMMELLSGAAILGHNIRFDLSFLRGEFRRCGHDISIVLGQIPVLDTVRIARRRFGRGGNGLQSLARRLGIDAIPHRGAIPYAQESGTLFHARTERNREVPDGSDRSSTDPGLREYAQTPACVDDGSQMINCDDPVAHRALPDARTTARVFERLIEPIGGWQICLCDCLREQGGPMSILPANPNENLLPLELEEALEARGDVEMEYLDGSGNRTIRHIQPLHLRRSGGELLLVAHCCLRNASRTFKLERIIQIRRAEKGR